MLRRSGLQALQALLHLAMASPQWCSVSELAEAQGLPAPMLEQLLLQLRRAELVEAKRGRQGGYRLSRAAESIPVGEVLSAVGAPLTLNGPGDSSRAEQQVLSSMGRRLQAALDRELKQLTLQELLFDLQSWQECLSNEGGLMLG